MSRCRFCGQDFSNKQAVRAHLKACTAYLGRFSRQAALPEANAELPLGNAETTSADHAEPEFDPVWQMQRQVSSEKLRLKLREVREAHAELDSREQAKQRAAAEQQAREAQLRDAEMRSREALRVRAQAEAETLERAREAKERLRGKRRAAIQETKRKVVDEWLLRFRLSSELKGQILQAIETALVSLPVEELPEAELVLISEGVRDQLYNRAVQAQAAAAGHGQQKLALQRYGMDYAQMELRAVEGLDFTERWRIETLVREELGELAGDESRDEVMAWVDEILEREGLELEDDPDAD